MTAATFLTGHETAPAPETPLVAGPRLSILDGLTLLQTPSGEAGVQAYHRALEGAPPEPATLLAELADLREGRTTRLELLAMIATSPTAAARGVGGPGLLLLRVARKAFIVSGVAARIRARRALASRAQDLALSARDTPSTSTDVARRLVVLEGALLRLENRVFAQAREVDAAGVAALEARVGALEAELKARLLEGSPPPP